MAEAILVFNAGSSSVKFAVVAFPVVSRTLFRGQVKNLEKNSGPLTLELSDLTGSTLPSITLDDTPGDPYHAAVEGILGWVEREVAPTVRVIAVGHRVVHGGTHFVEPVLIDESVLCELSSIAALAPLHQPPNLSVIAAARSRFAKLPQVACFDTAFHATQAPTARRYALPSSLSEQGVQRYGFHGLSYEYVASEIALLAPELTDRRLVVMHLGNGASLCAIKCGQSIATTMGFSTLDGLMMGTRCGALDPGVLLYLLQTDGRTVNELEHLLYYESGLLGVSGISSNMKTLLDSGDAAARAAIELFVYRVRLELGSMVAALAGIDAIVFTGGIGEHAAEIRRLICVDAQWCGVELNAGRNSADFGRAARKISSETSPVAVWVVPTDEEQLIARRVAAVLRSAQRP